MTVRYIQRKQGRNLETVDEFSFDTKEDRAEFRRMLAEYRLADPSADYYGSRRPCRDWLA